MGLILVVVSIIRIDFLSMNNILNILQNASTKGILALGCAGLIVLAGTDLSIGRVLGISAAVTASLVQSTTYASRMYPTMVSSLGNLGLLIPLFASIAVAVAFSMINGFGVAKLHLHAFIVTLGTQLIAYGVNCLYIESQPSGTAQALSTFDSNFLNVAAGAIYIGGIRIPLVVLYFLALATLVWVIWNKTKLGKNMFAVGGNTEAAAVSGVNVAKTIMLVYLMAGVLYGIASFLEAARITSVGANTGLNYETDAISAVVVGGVSFSGGVGTIQGVVIGAVILQAIGYALQFGLAWMINKSPKHMKKPYIMAIYAPSIAGGVLISVVWQVFFSSDRLGYLNDILLNLGVINNPVAWTQDKNWLLTYPTRSGGEGGMGVGFLSLFAGMQNVDEQLYEAGKIDGINSPLLELFYITIPSMKPQMLFSAVMAIVNALKSGSIGVQLSGQNPTPNYAGQLIQSHIEDYGFARFELGYATSLSFMLLVVTYILSRVCFRLLGTKEGD